MVEDLHLQDGLAFFNNDEAFTAEASASVKRLIGAVRLGKDPSHERHLEARAQPKGFHILRDRAVHLARATSVLDKIVSSASRQTLDALFLDYEPWVREIDRSDSNQEKIAAEEAEMRAANFGGRMTRNSNRAVYERYFQLDDEERRAWQESGLGPIAG